jgi:hypothetical protein
MLISMRGVLANYYKFKTNLLHTNYYNINAIKYSINYLLSILGQVQIFPSICVHKDNLIIK